MCVQERKREKKNTEKIKFSIIFFKKMNSRQKIKIKNKQNSLLVGHRAGVPCCPVNGFTSMVETDIRAPRPSSRFTVWVSGGMYSPWITTMSSGHNESEMYMN